MSIVARNLKSIFFREEFEDRSVEGFLAIHLGHALVHEDHIILILPGKLDGFFSAAGRIDMGKGVFSCSLQSPPRCTAS